jgi:NO-binding membrane sensor protein with MHYT domain
MTRGPLLSLIARVCSWLLFVSSGAIGLAGAWTMHRGVEADDGGAKLTYGATLVEWAIVIALPPWLFGLWRSRQRGKHNPPPGGGGKG